MLRFKWLRYLFVIVFGWFVFMLDILLWRYLMCFIVWILRKVKLVFLLFLIYLFKLVMIVIMCCCVVKLGKWVCLFVIWVICVFCLIRFFWNKWIFWWWLMLWFFGFCCFILLLLRNRVWMLVSCRVWFRMIWLRNILVVVFIFVC